MVSALEISSDEDGPVTASETPLNVLVVDDSRLQRRILEVSLRRRGYRVTGVGSAEEGLALVARAPVDLVISDWMMPGMSGVEFCRKLREIETANYLYIILLTTKSQTREIETGLEAGADDFLAKPVNATELSARIRAAQRLLEIERELTEKNRLVNSTLGELQTLYNALDRDLIEARQLQQSLVRRKSGSFGPAHVDLLLRPSGHVGGDLVGFFNPNTDELGLFSLDVSGHGVSAAMMTARLAGYLSGAGPGQSLAVVRGPDGGLRGRDPAQVAAELNRVLLTEMETTHYFTLFLALLDLGSGSLRFVQAGSPPALICDRSGDVRSLGSGGMPIGLLEDAEYQCVEARLSDGDRLMLLSDGLSECGMQDGTMVSDAELSALVAGLRKLGRPEFIEELQKEVLSAARQQEFEDDVSALILDFGDGQSIA